MTVVNLTNHFASAEDRTRQSGLEKALTSMDKAARGRVRADENPSHTSTLQANKATNFWGFKSAVPTGSLKGGDMARGSMYDSESTGFSLWSAPYDITVESWVCHIRHLTPDLNMTQPLEGLVTKRNPSPPVAGANLENNCEPVIELAAGTLCCYRNSA
ncbi:hypothetical protein CC1G_09631 [Coprinopsis cinerea okayama7|uniref:Uncharacterized protein n=1 Tax=Coprinopsis cinerea (strain Okayama-7 / 130 / ATCC MYA-4618 / FGSC 9003) TaxID=240176 RepID=A8N4E7_COPC7|nr:hypothetical protein CC1G_09631 [Coprinopsis cinerea okayama7\|eukprot:XP_001829742.2 hypothetical protein CC1G_09631 [Coprinopsis cinerea okayama7\